MADRSVDSNDEIDLNEIFQTIWIGKFQIILFITASLIAVFIFSLLKPYKDYISTTEIMPISSDLQDRYKLTNTFGFFRIERKLLLQQYLEQIQTESFLEEVFNKFDYIRKNDYPNEITYKEALANLISKVKITTGKFNSACNRFNKVLVERGAWPPVLIIIDLNFLSTCSSTNLVNRPPFSIAITSSALVSTN